MVKTIAFQADDINSLKWETDSSLYIAQHCYKLGAKVIFYNPENLCVMGGEVFAPVKELSFSADGFLVESSIESFPLASVNVLLIRQDPPVDRDYLISTQILDLLPKNVRVLNSTTGLRSFNEKLIAYKFAKYMPQTIVASNMGAAINFLKKHGGAIIKDINGYAGNAVKLIENDESGLSTLKDWFLRYGFLMLQQYLPNIKENGDKRVFIVFGKVMGAINRIPAKGSILANLAAGGSANVCELSDYELNMCTEIAVFLQSHGIELAGVDIIDEKLIEINITSPTGFKVYDVLKNTDYIGNLIANEIMKL